MWLIATTVSSWLWISSVNLLWCVADWYYSVCLALDLLGGSPLECSLTAATVSAWLWVSSVNLLWSVADCYYSVCWLWISSVDLPRCVADCYYRLWIFSVNLPWCVADCCYSVCLALDLLGGPPLVCGWLLLQCLPASESPRLTSSGVWLTATTVSAGSGSPRLTSPGVWLTATTGSGSSR